MKYLYQFAGIYGAFLLQSLFFEKLKIFSCSPDFTITVLIICSVYMDFVPSALLGAFAGLLTDVMYGTVFGVNLLKYMYVGIAVSILADKRHFNSPLIMSWICFISVSAAEIAMAVMKVLVGAPLSFGNLFANIFVRGIFAAVFAMVFILLTICRRRKTKAKVEKVSQGEGASV